MTKVYGALLGLWLLFFLFSAYQIHQYDEIGAQLARVNARDDHLNSADSQNSALIRSLWDGVTFGYFSNEGIFSEAKSYERQTSQIAGDRAELMYRFETARGYRRLATWLMNAVVVVAAALAGLQLLATRK